MFVSNSPIPTYTSATSKFLAHARPCQGICCEVVHIQISVTAVLKHLLCVFSELISYCSTTCRTQPKKGHRFRDCAVNGSVKDYDVVTSHFAPAMMTAASKRDRPFAGTAEACQSNLLLHVVLMFFLHTYNFRYSDSSPLIILL